MKPLQRIRKMRRDHHHGRSTDGARDVYYDPDIRMARLIAATLSKKENQK